MISSPIDEIKSKLDIIDVVGSYLKLQKAGANYRAPCPFHSEKKPSFFVSPARQMWRCFGCGVGGGMFDFVMKMEGVEFGDALRILAQKAGVELQRQDPAILTKRHRLYDICEIACRFFEKQLKESLAGKEVMAYLLGRGMTDETIKKWRLGYSPDTWQGLSDFLVSKGYKREEVEAAGLCLKSEKSQNYYDRFRGRIMFPVFDFSSQIVGFGGRVFKQKPRPDGQEEAKYINTPSTILYDKGKILYGLNRAGVEIRKKNACVVVEGYVDAIMVHQAGFENTVAASGTALTSWHLKILKRYSENIFLSFDMDIAGDNATKRGIDLAEAQGFNIKIIQMEQDKDPADIVLKNPGEWADCVLKAKSIYDYYFDNAFLKYDKNTVEGKKGASKILLPILKRIPNEIEKSLWIQKLAGILGVKEESISEELNKIKITNQEIPDFSGENSGAKNKSAGENKIEDFSPKNRKELLEECLVALAVKNPLCLEFVSNQDLLFFSPKASRMIEYLKAKNKDATLLLPPDSTDFFNYISLKAEIGDFVLEKGIADLEEKPDKEFQWCLREMKILECKNKLDDISNKIKQAEVQQNLEETQKLVQEFNFYSGSLRGLDISSVA